MTLFCYAEIPVYDDLSFFVDGNSKITRDDGFYAEPKPNAFSLPHVSTCPGSTPLCRKDCYVHGLQTNAPDVFAKYVTNATALQRALLTRNGFHRTAETLGAWIWDNCTSFRWHVSGDVMHRRHAEWIAEVCDQASATAFWIYTKTFEVVDVLAGLPNLVVNLSGDAHNWSRCLATHKAFPTTRAVYMTQGEPLPSDLPSDAVIFPDHIVRGRALPDSRARHGGAGRGAAWQGIPR